MGEVIMQVTEDVYKRQVGGSEAIDIALRAMLNPGDEVLIPQPVSYTHLKYDF